MYAPVSCADEGIRSGGDGAPLSDAPPTFTRVMSSNLLCPSLSGDIGELRVSDQLPVRGAAPGAAGFARSGCAITAP